jgi:hypothetical protein
MHKNILWRAFLLVVFAITLFYSGIALYRYYAYVSLSGQARPTAMEWNILKETDSQYIIETPYQFSVSNKTYTGKTVWEEKNYLNEYAAQEAIEDANGNTWVVYYNPRDPEKSSLERRLPVKEVAYAIFLWGLFLYFLWLGFYVGSFKSGVQ